MKKKIKYCIVILSILFVVKLIYLINPMVDYPLDDCVTYFDNKARYQLIEIKDYYIQDLQNECSIFNNVTRYTFHNDVLYVEFNEFKGYDGEPHHDNSIYENLYGTYNILTEEKVVYDEIEKFDEGTRNIFNNDRIMIDLNPNKNSFEKWLSGVIPLKYRKR